MYLLSTRSGLSKPHIWGLGKTLPTLVSGDYHSTALLCPPTCAVHRDALDSHICLDSLLHSLLPCAQHSLGNTQQCGGRVIADWSRESFSRTQFRDCCTI